MEWRLFTLSGISITILIKLDSHNFLSNLLKYKNLGCVGI